MGLRWSAASRRLALVAIVLLSQLLLWVDRGADPPLGWGVDESVIAEGLADLDAARSLAGESGAPPASDAAPARPLVTIPAALVLRVAGVGLGPARVLSVLGTVGLALLVAGTLRRRFGDAAALLGAGIVCFHGASFALARAPSVLPWAMLGGFALLVLASRRGTGASWLAFALLPIVSELGHPSTRLLAVPILLEASMRTRPIGGWLRAIPFPAVVLAAGAAILGWLGLESGVRTAFLASLRGSTPLPGPPALAVVPLLLPLAWCGWLSFVAHADARPGPGRALERLLHGAVWVALGAAALDGGIDAPDLLGLVPLLAWIAVAASERAGAGPRRRRLPLDGGRGGLLAVCGGLGTLLLLGEWGRVVGEGSLPVRGLALPVVAVVLLVAFGPPRDRRLPARVVSLSCGLLIVTAGLWQCALCLGHPLRSIERTARQLERCVLPTAVLTGPSARVLTLENDLGWARDGDDARVTHRIHEGCPRSGEPAVEELHALGRPLVLARSVASPAGWSAFEIGRRDEREGRLTEARTNYFLVLRGDPAHAPSWLRIAVTLERQGEVESAYHCLLNALTGDPDAPEVLRRLADLYLERGRTADAGVHLRRLESVGEGGVTGIR